LEGAQEYEAARKEVSRMLGAQLPKDDAKGVQELKTYHDDRAYIRKGKQVDERTKRCPKESPEKEDEKNMIREHTSSL
jgi:hypothetical protein